MISHADIADIADVALRESAAVNIEGAPLWHIPTDANANANATVQTAVSISGNKRANQRRLMRRDFASGLRLLAKPSTAFRRPNIGRLTRQRIRDCIEIAAKRVSNYARLVRHI